MAVHPGFGSLTLPIFLFFRLDVNENNKEHLGSTEDDAARQEQEERDRKRRERVQEALLRWAKAPKKRGRFQR